jgi:glutamate-1-semialdehyde 2,1-aminomutase
VTVDDLTDPMDTVDRGRLRQLTLAELKSYRERHPESAKRYDQARQHMLAGVPMSWMLKWASAQPIAGQASGFPLFAQSASGSRLVDVDGLEYVDFCLGDTGAMTGHSPPALAAKLRDSAAEGFTYMLPTDWGIAAAAALTERFGLPKWQFTVSATDANRFAIRVARALTGRPKVLVFNHCYHGTVDESLASLDDRQAVVNRTWNLGPPTPVAETTRVVEFNDVSGLQQELAHGDVACVITEPALTNVGIVLPQPSFHRELRRLTREHGTLLMLDETHTFSVGPGGYTAEHGLEPDVLTIGKAVGGGVPAAAWGVSAAVAARLEEDDYLSKALIEGIGIGGTLAGNALSAQAIATTLETSLTRDDFSHMIALARQWTRGVERIIERAGLPWHVTHLGARAEFHFVPEAPENGSELAAIGDEELERFLRLFLINRGVLTTPFHNMALMAPTTTEEDVVLHEELLAAAVEELTAS